MQKAIRVAILLIPAFLLIMPDRAEPGMLYHATKRSLAKRIFTRGFSTAKMSRKARFGKGAYFASSRRTALREKPGADAVAVFKDTRSLKRSTLPVNRMSKGEIKKFSGDRDLRGNIRRGVIGPKLGRRIGSRAGTQGKNIAYTSARDKKGTNIFIPSRVYKKNPRLIKPVRIEANGK